MNQENPIPPLRRCTLLKDPVEQFAVWFEEAKDKVSSDYTVMTLGTASKEGIPSTRIVLLKKFDLNGFVFFTNYMSRKGKEIKENPYASLTIYWEELKRQVNIQGQIKKIPREQSEEYFISRARGSQIATWASKQSQPVDSREELEKSFYVFQEQFNANPIPCPPDWGGYCVIPSTMIFWQSGEHRLHDRFQYKIVGNEWTLNRLAP